ncbi:MAG: YjbH domain-containing protein, partial [Alphaproteobacteria bacterium]|nr:YjbH domain-containing protein [Alphaproteobacteria bacterium]
MKFRLLEEGSWWPQIAVGLQDGVGTGLFAGEYLVASKRYYDLDFSFGMGWGYFASGSRIKNPLTTFSPVFESRQSSGALGGQANLGDYFSGPNVGLFGGVAWRTPVRGLTLKIEASTQDYQSEPLGNRFDRGLPYNFGLVYRPFSWLELSGAYERGDTAMFRASLRASVNDVDLPKFDKPPPTLKPRTRKQQTAATPPPGTVVAGDADFSLRPRPVATIVQPGDPEPVRPARRWAATDDGATSAQVASPRRHDAVVAHLFDGFEAQRMQISSIETDANEARIYLSAGLREAPQWRMLKAAQLVTASLPARTARVVLIERSGGIVRRRVSLRRNEIERTAIVDYLFDNLEDKGFVIESIDLSHSRARLVMSRVPVFDGDVERQAAEIVFKAAPTPIEKVEIVQLDNGRQLSRAIVRRADVLRAAKIDQMFDGLEAHGFEIESLELSRGRALVYLSSPRHDDQDAYQAAARLVARTAPDPVASVEVVRLIAGVEATRVSWHRSGSTAGTSDERVVPDLTDNEKNQVALKVFKELEDNGFGVEKFEITRRKASVFVTPTQFREYARNVGRASRIVAKHAPPSVEELQVVTMNAGLETARVTIMRNDLEAAVRRLGSPEEIWTRATIGQPQPSPPFGGTAEDAT